MRAEDFRSNFLGSLVSDNAVKNIFSSKTPGQRLQNRIGDKALTGEQALERFGAERIR